MSWLPSTVLTILLQVVSNAALCSSCGISFTLSIRIALPISLATMIPSIMHNPLLNAMIRFQYMAKEWHLLFWLLSARVKLASLSLPLPLSLSPSLSLSLSLSLPLPLTPSLSLPIFLSLPLSLPLSPPPSLSPRVRTHPGKSGKYWNLLIRISGLECTWIPSKVLESTGIWAYFWCGYSAMFYLWCSLNYVNS